MADEEGVEPADAQRARVSGIEAHERVLSRVQRQLLAQA